jgi:mRNA-degrading endonuclease RelE of RelBE toxin-antitoxin system
MTYHVAWSSPARRAISSLPEKAATAIVEFIYATIADNPQRSGHGLHLELAGQFSARRGDFRVIYEIGDDTETITIQAIGHRSDIYRPR